MKEIINKIDISTKIKNIKLSSCIMNASGALCSTEKELSDLLDSSSGALVTKSCTSDLRNGNPKPRYFEWNVGSINSMGLPNLGIDFYINFLKRKKTNKPVFLSISGFSLKENLYLIKKANLIENISALEINFSCPNILNRKKIFGYDSLYVYKFLKNVFKFNKKPLGIKLPPYFNEIHIKNISSIINRYPVMFVTCVNSIPNGLYINSDTESVVIRPNNGFGGIGGEIIKPFGLANVSKFFSFLRKDIYIIGCGGISSGKDIFDYILCGASAVQIGTQFIKEGISVFDRLKKELKNFLKKKNYFSIKNFFGNLKKF
ncbi:dihydroorotate oxidase [Blattabacterium cuenoti]|uniref:dihydroorotate oxidase n=1 Tax=Blattabacterium cuenoti TaxID=1653831 RepID=UPI001EEB7132|nr:dihydroorotate oxidase [Blattabacterium cuenoti]